ncbi:hypothetical protein BJ878DRAFT_477392 [Calycina marina]|uniref:Uncharacterized protein n=1 Tax=Calycina marina TaxID=1763456 RepID=A0A9P7Z8R3_9HELO|nr:hypothetical protein BJ878DRAFT_477392 [Calycina marina]
MFKSPKDIDEELEGLTTLEFWQKLKKKYEERGATVARRYMDLISNFTLEYKKEDNDKVYVYTNIEVWNKLHEYRRKLQGADLAPVTAYNMLRMTMVKALRGKEDWKSTLDSIKVRSLTVDEKIDFLQRREQRLEAEARDTEEGAFAAYDKHRGGIAKSSSRRGGRTGNFKRKSSFVD